MKTKHYVLVLATMLFTLYANGETSEIVSTEPFFVRGTTTAFCKAYINEENSNEIEEYGICWNTSTAPTIEDSKKAAETGKIFITLDNLTADTDYYARAYAIDKTGNASYGEEINIKTITKGEITYEIARDGNPDNEAIFDNLENSVIEALEYYNNFTSITNKHIRVQYNTGVATADANYAGSMRFGKNQSYHRVGTVLHELAHVMGGGQHSSWWEYMVNGKWTGENANKILQFMTGNPDDYVKGDQMHFWPYGINGAHEDTGEEMLYLINVLIVQGMVEDGLVPYEAPVPDRVFEPAEGEKYYLKTCNVPKGRNTSFLKTTSDDKIISAEISNEKVIANDSSAWFIYAVEETEYYFIQNAATGKYLCYSGEYNSTTGYQGENMIILKSKGENDNQQRFMFRLKDPRNSDYKNKEDVYFTEDVYGILMDETQSNQALYLRSDKNTGTNAYSNSRSDQQWSFLTEEILKNVPPASDVNDAKDTSDISIYVNQGNIYIVSPTQQTSYIYSVEGNLILKTDNDIIPVESGFYIVKTGGKAVKVFVK